jgi:hypothetical protein
MRLSLVAHRARLSPQYPPLSRITDSGMFLKDALLNRTALNVQDKSCGRLI